MAAPATQPQSPVEMLKLQTNAKQLGVDFTLDEIAGAGWVNARALMQDHNDGTLLDDVDDSESYGEIVRFTDLDNLT